MNLETAMLISRSKGSLDAQISRVLERVGLAFDDLRRLQSIGRSAHGISRPALAEAMDETSSQSLRTVLPMEKLGWVSRSDTGRFVLTDSGTLLLDQAVEMAEAAAQRWFAATAIDPAAVSTALAPLVRES